MRKFRTILMAFVVLLAVQGAMAQSKTKTVIQTDEGTVITTVKKIPTFTPKHDIRVGIGSVCVETYFLLDSSNGYYDELVYDFRREMLAADTYRTPRLFLGNYTLSYTYHSRSWLQYGVTLGFGASTQWVRDSYTGKKIGTKHLYSLSVMPTMRFTWFNRDIVQLYSSIAVAGVTDFDSLYAWFDLTFVGCSVGRKFYGFAECGGGMSGIFRVGCGYRFNAKKK